MLAKNSLLTGRENRRKKEKGSIQVQALQEERVTYFDHNRLSRRLSVSKWGADWNMFQQLTFEWDKVKICSRRSLTLFLFPCITQSITHYLVLFLPLTYILRQPFLHHEHIVLRGKGLNVHVTEHMVLKEALRNPTVRVHLNARAELQVSTLHTCFTAGPCMYRVSTARWSKAKKKINLAKLGSAYGTFYNWVSARSRSKSVMAARTKCASSMG